MHSPQQLTEWSSTLSLQVAWLQFTGGQYHLLILYVFKSRSYPELNLSLWYSACFNPIKGGRRVSMQHAVWALSKCAPADEEGCLTVMEAVPMYHVCSFHKRLQTQLIPFRFRNTWREKKDWDESFCKFTPGNRSCHAIFRTKRKRKSTP